MAKPKHIKMAILRKQDRKILTDYERVSNVIKQRRAKLKSAEADRNELIDGVLEIFQRRQSVDGILLKKGLVSVVWDPQKPPSIAQLLEYIEEHGGKQTAFYKKLKRIVRKLTKTIDSQVRYRLDNGERNSK